MLRLTETLVAALLAAQCASAVPAPQAAPESTLASIVFSQSISSLHAREPMPTDATTTLWDVIHAREPEPTTTKYILNAREPEDVDHPVPTPP